MVSAAHAYIAPPAPIYEGDGVAYLAIAAFFAVELAADAGLLVIVEICHKLYGYVIRENTIWDASRENNPARLFSLVQS